MNKTLYLIFICLLLCAGTHLVAQTFDYNRVSGHPRLLRTLDFCDLSFGI